MASEGEGAASGRAPGPAGRSLAPPDAGAPLHERSFKLRFALQCELGRSHVSAVKPLSLPAMVTGKLHRRQREAGAAGEAGAAPLRRVRDMFRGPADRFPQPATTSHQYGWWVAKGEGMHRDEGSELARLDYRIRDSAWLKARVHLLAADASYKR